MGDSERRVFAWWTVGRIDLCRRSPPTAPSNFLKRAARGATAYHRGTAGFNNQPSHHRCGDVVITDHDLHFPESSGIDSGEPELIRKYLNDSYRARIDLDTADEMCFWSHSRVTVGRYATEEFKLDGEVRLTADHAPLVVVMSPLSGRIECHCAGQSGAAGPEESVLVSVGGDGLDLRLSQTHARAVVLERGLLDEVAGAGDSAMVRFTGLTPRTAALANMLGSTERYVTGLISSRDMSENLLLLNSAGRLLASTVLAAFANDMPGDAGPDDEITDSHPLLLRQATEFIQANAARDIGVVDVANAVFLTPRTVQYMFRRHLDTTPSAYLREVRLHRARQELQLSDRNTATVAAVASKWGFAHTGRFAVTYRQRYGESPHETLRR
jgi:AraC-like DNA-binding protein